MNRRTEKGRTIIIIKWREKKKDEITPNAQGNLFENTDHPEGDCESVINIHASYKYRESRANETEEMEKSHEIHSNAHIIWRDVASGSESEFWIMAI